MSYAAPIRILHSLLATSMIAQLAVGELMGVPGIAEGPEGDEAFGLIGIAQAHEGHADVVQPVTAGFEVHEFLGLFVAALLLARLLLAFSSVPGAGWHELFPWLSAAGRSTLISEACAQFSGWKQGRLAPPEQGESVARSVHGLMLLTAILVGATGVGLFFGWNEHGRQSELVGMIGETHETLVGLLEALLGLHVLAVVLHQLQGHNILARIKPGKA